MSGLSANTYSWGGDGDRFRGGGEASLGGCSLTLEKYFWIPFLDLATGSLTGSSSSISEGAGDSEDKEERSEESSSADILQTIQFVGVC
jgi:hypothetical protein